MKLLISLPAYNEEQAIKQVIRSIRLPVLGFDEAKIIVFDDGSSDRTAAGAAEAGAEVVSHERNLGLSLTFQRIIERALQERADALVNIDADGQFDAADIARLVKPVVDQRADFVTASRFMDERLTPRMPALKKFGNKVVAWLISSLSGQKFYDVSCGFRAYSREALLHLNLFSKFTYTHETFLTMAFKNMRIFEIPLRVRGEREFGQSKVANNLWRYGYNMGNTIFRTVLDYKPLRFFGWGGGIVFLLGVIFDLFVLIHWITTGEITPFKSFGFAGLFLNLFGLLLLIVGLLADMINRVRLTQERILYIGKKQMHHHLQS